MSGLFMHHVHLVCGNLKENIAFWTEGFGAQVVDYRKFGEYEGAMLDFGAPTRLFLTEKPCTAYDSQCAGFEHIGIHVLDLQKTLDRLLAMPGVRMHIPPYKGSTATLAFVTGPDGIVVELMEPFDKKHLKAAS